MKTSRAIIIIIIISLNYNNQQKIFRRNEFLMVISFAYKRDEAGRFLVQEQFN